MRRVAGERDSADDDPTRQLPSPHLHDDVCPVDGDECELQNSAENVLECKARRVTSIARGSTRVSFTRTCNLEPIRQFSVTQLAPRPGRTHPVQCVSTRYAFRPLLDNVPKEKQRDSARPETGQGVNRQADGAGGRQGPCPF